MCYRTAAVTLAFLPPLCIGNYHNRTTCFTALASEPPKRKYPLASRSQVAASFRLASEPTGSVFIRATATVGNDAQLQAVLICLVLIRLAPGPLEEAHPTRRFGSQAAARCCSANIARSPQT